MTTCKTINGYTWRQSGRRLILHVSDDLDLFWEMPQGFELPSTSTLSAAEFILFSSYTKKVEVEPFTGKRKRGVSLAFSGGIDCSASLRLLPNPTPIYNLAHDWPTTQENALLAVEEVGGFAILTNQNQLPRLFGKGIGYYGFGGFSVSAILLSEHLGHDTLSDGNIIEFIYLYDKAGHGTRFNPRRNFRRFHDALGIAGLFYCMPVAGMTEVITTRIAPDLKYIMGCTRGRGGNPCLNCLKCYRKEAIKGNLLPTNTMVDRAFAKEPIAVLATYLWAKRTHGLSHPALDGYEDKDISWVEGWYPRSIEHVPEHLRGQFLQKLKDLAVEPISDLSTVENWSAFSAT